MSKVALRLYNREIETLIDQGHIDEAIAHCQHILKTYPKHLETYRLLGKAYLEARRYDDSADIFQRVLLAVPDDFVSHLGMSIVCDEQKDLDGAIWHMERAFEISSTNTGVQGELRRLRGRRDGMEPPKIQLTRGALAQIYTKGGEYQQAITEIKAVLAEDETRSDMKTLLARAYFRAGMRNEATETCIELLKQYPYSLDANRILVEILPGTSMAQGVDQYKRRIESLDPYLAMVTGSVFETDNLPDNAVNIERLEWDPNAQPAQSWTMSEMDAGEPEKAVETPAEQIPDWLKQSGWGQATGDFKEGPVNFDEPEPAAPAVGEGGLAAAEIPDWLKAMAPPGATASAPAEAASEAMDLDWLAGLGAPVSESPAEAAAPAPLEPISSEVLPAESADDNQDWLSNLGSAAAATGLAADESLDWLSNLTPPQGQEVAATGEVSQPVEETLPDWLSTLNESQPAEPVSEALPEPSAEEIFGNPPSGLDLPGFEIPVDQPLAEAPTLESTPDWGGDFAAPQTTTAETPAAAEPMPDWLKDIAGQETAQPLSDLVSGPGTSEAEQDESLHWLESLAEKQGAKAEELITNPADRREAIPDWVNQVGDAPEAPKAEAAPSEYIPEKPIEVEAEPMEGELSPLVSGPGTTEAEQDDAFKWLENLAAGQGAKSEELLTKPEERAEHAPGWVGEVTNPPTELSALISGPGTSSSEQDDALLWLESLAQKQGAKPEELITKPEERKQVAPDWIGQVGQVPDQVVQSEPLQEMPSEPVEGIPDWLSQVEPPASEQATQPEPVQETSPAPVEGLPEWLGQAELTPEPLLQPEPVQETPAQPVEEVKPPEPSARHKLEEEFVPGSLSGLVSGPGTTAAEQDDALLWLESLAQKQGAKPEELITKPEERKEVAPDWVAQVGQEPEMSAEPVAPEASSVPEAASGAESLAWLQGLAAEEPAVTEQPSEPSAVSAEAQGEEPLAWLQGLAAEEPAAAEQPVEQFPEEPAVVSAMSPGDESLAWLQGLEGDVPAQAGQPVEETPVAEQPVEPEIQPADQNWFKDLETAALGTTPAAAADEGLAWLNDLGKPLEETPLPATPEQPILPSMPEPQAVEPAETPVSGEAPLDWLEDLAQGEVSEQAEEVLPWEQETPAEASQPEEVAPEAQPPVAEQAAPDSMGITDWLKHLDVEEQAAPPVAENSAAESEELPDWLKDTSADEQPPVPEPVQGWMPTEGTPVQPPAEEAVPVSLLEPSEAEPPAQAETVPPVSAVTPEAVVPAAEPAPQPVAEAVSTPPRPALRQTGMLGGDKDALAFQRARDLLGRGGLDQAMGEYTKLIKKGKLLEEVIYDLQEAVYSHPVDVIVWQTLGDAFVRSNRLQEALDAYSKAEELLR